MFPRNNSRPATTGDRDGNSNAGCAPPVFLLVFRSVKCNGDNAASYRLIRPFARLNPDREIMHMRRFPLAVFIFFLSVCFALPVAAEVKEFRDFSVDLPPGWDIQREGITVAFIARDKSATMVVTVESTVGMFAEGMSAEELAQAYADELKGSKPVMAEPNYYSFTFKSPGGVDSEASIVVVGKRFYLITISGKNKDLAAMVESVLLSIL